MMTSFIMNNILRFQGKAFLPCSLTTGGILNIVLDPVFIFGMDMGTAGAALGYRNLAVCQLLHFACHVQPSQGLHFD